jgi:short-subunit dehydrogenase
MTYLITGASSGIGEALALEFAAPGVTLLLVARRYERLEKVQKLCQAKGASIQIFCVDLSDLEKAYALGKTLSAFCIDVIIFNAGISTGHKSLITPLDKAKEVYHTNVLSVHALLEPMLPKLFEQKALHVVFISSLASLFTMPSSLIYSSSKRALNAYAQGLALQFAMHKHFDVSVILPGFITTELTDKNDFKMPFLMPLDKATKRISKAIRNKKRFVAFPYRFYLLIQLVAHLPHFLRVAIIKLIAFNKTFKES